MKKKSLFLLGFVLAGCGGVDKDLPVSILKPPPVSPILNPKLTCDFTVNSTADTVDSSPGDGQCRDASGNCTLRAGIMEANVLGGTKVICLQSGQTYNLSIDTAGGDNDTGAEDDLDISADIIIEGNGSTVQRGTALTCNLNGTNDAGEFRIFHVLSGGRLTLRDLKVKNGCADGQDGGGILNEGALTLFGSTVEGNRAWLGGGGILNKGTLTLLNSTLEGNSARTGDGGGLYNYTGGTAVVEGSTVAGNSAVNGGGIINGNGALSLKNSTIASNSANSKGGGIYNYIGTAGASFITIAGNSAGSQGGGIHNLATLSIKNSIVANNEALGVNNCTGSITASGVNFADDSTCTGFSNNNTPLTDLKLQPLGNYGGPTKTIALGAVSVAVNSVSNCTDLSGSTVSTDQRGVRRPQGGRCDAGAYEMEIYTLSVSPVPSGGFVVSSPSSINCGESQVMCIANFLPSESVVLSAVPLAGYTFSGWGGDCSSCGTSATCNITMSSDKTCSASFSASAGGGGGGGSGGGGISVSVLGEFKDGERINFGSAYVGSRKGPAVVKLEGSGNVSVSISQEGEQNFTLASAGDKPCPAKVFNLSGYCTVGVIFEPKSQGEKSAYLVVNNTRVYMVGTGIAETTQVNLPSGGGCSMVSNASPVNTLAWLMLPLVALLRRRKLS